jgi:hypothetical protein
MKILILFFLLVVVGIIVFPPKPTKVVAPVVTSATPPPIVDSAPRAELVVQPTPTPLPPYVPGGEINKDWKAPKISAKEQRESKKQNDKYAREKEAGNEPVVEGWFNIAESEIKALLNDPDSYHYESSQSYNVTFGGYGAWKTIVYFRAKNGYGGYTKGSAVIYSRNNEVLSTKLLND